VVDFEVVVSIVEVEFSYGVALVEFVFSFDVVVRIVVVVAAVVLDIFFTGMIQEHPRQFMPYLLSRMGQVTVSLKNFR